MLYKDRIREKEFLKLARERGICLSIFLPTTPITQDAQANRITLKNLAKRALEQAQTIADKRQTWPMEEYLEALQEDDGFWEFQANGLAVLVTPESIRTYRLAHSVEEAAEVSDRFHLKPLVPSLQPKAAYVLALSQKSVALYEFTAAQQLEPVDVPDLPTDFSDATKRTLQRDRAPARRLQGDEGAKVLQTQFLRAVEKAVRPVVSGSNMPLILATTANLQALYRSVNSYDLLAAQSVDSSVEKMPEEELKQAVIPLVAELRQARIQRWVDLYRQREAESRASTDLATIAKVATQGQVSDLLVDADAVRYGTISEQGEITTADQRSAESYDLIDEIMDRVMENGGDVLAIRKDDDAPAELLPIAAVLRWA